MGDWDFGLAQLVGVPASDPMYTVRRDDYLQLEIARYF